MRLGAGEGGFFIVERRREHSERATICDVGAETAPMIARREMHRRSNEFKNKNQKKMGFFSSAGRGRGK